MRPIIKFPDFKCEINQFQTCLCVFETCIDVCSWKQFSHEMKDFLLFMVPTFPDRQNSLTFKVVCFPFSQYFFNVLLFKIKTLSILANNTQLI